MKNSGKIVLIVDDDELVLGAVGGMLRRGGYTPICVSSPQDALEQSRDLKIDIRLLLTDLVMPRMDGLTLAQQVLSERPGIRVLLMTGKSGVLSRVPAIRKPFSTAQLLAQISKAIDSPPPFPVTYSPHRVLTEPV